MVPGNGQLEIIDLRGKSSHNAVPLLFKKIERVGANMFLFFISLLPVSK